MKNFKKKIFRTVLLGTSALTVASPIAQTVVMAEEATGENTTTTGTTTTEKPKTETPTAAKGKEVYCKGYFKY